MKHGNSGLGIDTEATAFTSPVSFSCQTGTCTAIFDQYLALRRHVQTKHARGSPVAATLTVRCLVAHKSGISCSLTYKTISKFQAHLRNVHNINPLQCQKCGSEFRRWNTLERHWESCIGDKLPGGERLTYAGLGASSHSFSRYFK